MKKTTANNQLVTTAPPQEEDRSINDASLADAGEDIASFRRLLAQYKARVYEHYAPFLTD